MNGPPDAGPVPPPVSRREGLALAGVLAAGLALRVWTALAAYYSTFDSATVGLMALNILKGERPLFFYGQTYFGGFESYLAAGLFALFGASEFTLSMSAILFSLGWIVATWLLFREGYGPWAGIAAALTIALPGWTILWYCVATYGGYPAAFLLGTVALWICVRIWRRDLSGRALWIHALLLGLVTGLALWTHFIAAAYILFGAGLVVAHLVRHRFAPRLMLPFAAAFVVFLAGFAPVLLTPGALAGGEHVSRFEFTPSLLLNHFASVFQRPLRAHLFADWDKVMAVRRLMRAAVAASAVLFALRIIEARGWRARVRIALPMGFCVVFLALYVPHAMATFESPRYLIPLWTVFLAGLLTAPLDSGIAWLRRTGAAMLVAWVGYYTVGDVHAIVRGAPQRAEVLRDRGEVVAAARAAGLRSAVMVGPALFGHQGQALDFAARGEIAFVNAYDERHRPSAALAEADDRCGFVVEPEGLPTLLAALADVGTTSRVRTQSWLCVVSDLAAPVPPGVALPAAALRASDERGAPAPVLFDRCRGTSLSGDYGRGRGFTIQLDRPREIAGLRWFAPDDLQEGLPTRFAIHASIDGRSWTTVRPPIQRTAVAYACGRRVYVKGYLGWADIHFRSPATARFLRIEMLAGQRQAVPAWNIAEMAVFERTGVELPPATVSEVRKIGELLVERRVRFAAAGRWVSAQLDAGEWRDDLPAVFPVPNPKFPDTMVDRRIVPAPGLAIVADRALAAECEAALGETCGAGVAWERVDFERHAVLLFTRGPETGRLPGGAELEWYAGLVLRRAEGAGATAAPGEPAP